MRLFIHKGDMAKSVHDNHVSDIVVVLLAFCTGCSAQCSWRNRPQELQATFTYQYFTSPGYAYGQYPLYSNCAWLISAEPGYVVQVHGPLSLEGHNFRCLYDSVTAYDGDSENSPELGKVCGRTYARFQSTGRYMYVYFTSDNSITRSGFRFYYRATRYDHTFIPSTTTATTTTLWNPWGDRTSTTTSSSFNFVHNHSSPAAMIGGIAGSFFLVFLCVGLCRYFHNRNLPQQTQRQLPAFMTRASGSGPAHGNNTVVMTATGGVQATGPSGGNVNLGYLPYSESPPSYDSLHPSGPPANSMALPSYSEAITMSGVSDTPKPN